MPSISWRARERVAARDGRARPRESLGRRPRGLLVALGLRREVEPNWATRSRRPSLENAGPLARLRQVGACHRIVDHTVAPLGTPARALAPLWSDDGRLHDVHDPYGAGYPGGRVPVATERERRREVPEASGQPPETAVADGQIK
eukprot:884304-Pyramimonas_sp.AAC.1